MKIAIVGREKDTRNYVKYISTIPAEPVTTLSIGILASCDGIVLPGGGDITPVFFGEHNNGSRNIDTELDIIQFQALEYAISHRLPVMGICKGMQVINVAFGGGIIQDLSASAIHAYNGEDQYHFTNIEEASFLADIYGTELEVNSAHHQGLKHLGQNLKAVQWCPRDHCVEGITHESLPVFGVQWHPERLDKKRTTTMGGPLLAYFVSLVSASWS